MIEQEISSLPHKMKRFDGVYRVREQSESVKIYGNYLQGKGTGGKRQRVHQHVLRRLLTIIYFPPP